MTKDHGLPSVRGIEGAKVTSLNDEHATIALPPASTIAIGDLLELLPSHIDPTINLHDVFYVVEPGAAALADDRSAAAVHAVRSALSPTVTLDV